MIPRCEKSCWVDQCVHSTLCWSMCDLAFWEVCLHLRLVYCTTLPFLLCQLNLFFQVCYFTNSGSEANDVALKMARIYTKAHDIVSLRWGLAGLWLCVCEDFLLCETATDDSVMSLLKTLSFERGMFCIALAQSTLPRHAWLLLCPPPFSPSFTYSLTFLSLFLSLSPSNGYHGAGTANLPVLGLTSWKPQLPQAFGAHQAMNPDVYRGPWGGARCRDSPVQVQWEYFLQPASLQPFLSNLKFSLTPCLCMLVHVLVLQSSVL